MDYQTIERIKNALDDSSIGPETVALMLTRVCNLNCLYCRGGRVDKRSRSYPDISDELSTEELFSLFEDARDLKVKEINLGGMDGEPFCKKDILKIIQRIKDLGFIGSMTTNGSFLNSEVAKAMTGCHWDILLISFDAVDESIQHALRPARNQNPYFKNIIQFLEFLDKNDSELRILLNVVITKFNYRGLPELIKFANNYRNIESANILKLLNMGLENYRNLQLNDEELKEFKSILLSLKNEKKLMYLSNWIELQDAPSGIPAEESENKLKIPDSNGQGKCFTNYYILSIDSNGDVIKCPQYQLRVEGLNIKGTSLRELWRGGHLRFRNKLAEDASCFDGCCTILKEQNRFIYNKIGFSKTLL